MTSFDLAVRFEIQPCKTFAKAYVNDVYVGRVYINSMKNKKKEWIPKLVFRCSDNPFRNVTPNISVSDSDTVESMLADPFVHVQLIPVVIRNALYNYALLPQKEKLTDAYSFVRDAA